MVSKASLSYYICMKWIIPAHWRTAAPSLFGEYGHPQECPENSAIFNFKTRARDIGSVDIKDDTEDRTYGYLTEVMFQCTDIQAAKNGNQRKSSHDMLFSIMEGKS